jgi:hypothetical protein
MPQMQLPQLAQTEGLPDLLPLLVVLLDRFRSSA